MNKNLRQPAQQALHALVHGGGKVWAKHIVKPDPFRSRIYMGPATAGRTRNGAKAVSSPCTPGSASEGWESCRVISKKGRGILDVKCTDDMVVRRVDARLVQLAPWSDAVMIGTPDPTKPSRRVVFGAEELLELVALGSLTKYADAAMSFHTWFNESSVRAGPGRPRTRSPLTCSQPKVERFAQQVYDDLISEHFGFTKRDVGKCQNALFRRADPGVATITSFFLLSADSCFDDDGVAAWKDAQRAVRRAAERAVQESLAAARAATASLAAAMATLHRSVDAAAAMGSSVGSCAVSLRDTGAAGLALAAGSCFGIPGLAVKSQGSLLAAFARGLVASASPPGLQLRRCLVSSQQQQPHSPLAVPPPQLVGALTAAFGPGRLPSAALDAAFCTYGTEQCSSGISNGVGGGVLVENLLLRLEGKAGPLMKMATTNAKLSSRMSKRAWKGVREGFKELRPLLGWSGRLTQSDKEANDALRVSLPHIQIVTWSVPDVDKKHYPTGISVGAIAFLPQLRFYVQCRMGRRQVAAHLFVHNEAGCVIGLRPGAVLQVSSTVDANVVVESDSQYGNNKGTLHTTLTAIKVHLGKEQTHAWALIILCLATGNDHLLELRASVLRAPPPSALQRRNIVGEWKSPWDQYAEVIKNGLPLLPDGKRIVRPTGKSAEWLDHHGWRGGALMLNVKHVADLPDGSGARSKTGHAHVSNDRDIAYFCPIPRAQRKMTRVEDGQVRFGCFVGVSAATQKRLVDGEHATGTKGRRMLEKTFGICGENEFVRDGIAQDGDDISPGIWHLWATSSGKQASNEALIASGCPAGWKKWLNHQHHCVSVKGLRFDFLTLPDGRLKTIRANKGRLLQWANLPAEEVWTCTGACKCLRSGDDTSERFSFISGWQLEALGHARRMNAESYQTAQLWDEEQFKQKRVFLRAQRLSLNSHWALMVGAQNLTPKYPAGAYLIPNMADKLPPGLTLTALDESPTERHHCGRNLIMRAEVKRGGGDGHVDKEREAFLESLLLRVARKMAVRTGHFDSLLRSAMGCGGEPWRAEGQRLPPAGAQQAATARKRAEAQRLAALAGPQQCLMLDALWDAVASTGLDVRHPVDNSELSDEEFGVGADTNEMEDEDVAPSAQEKAPFTLQSVKFGAQYTLGGATQACTVPQHVEHGSQCAELRLVYHGDQKLKLQQLIVEIAPTATAAGWSLDIRFASISALRVLFNGEVTLEFLRPMQIRRKADAAAKWVPVEVSKTNLRTAAHVVMGLMTDGEVPRLLRGLGAMGRPAALDVLRITPLHLAEDLASEPAAQRAAALACRVDAWKLFTSVCPDLQPQREVLRQRLAASMAAMTAAMPRGQSPPGQLETGSGKLFWVECPKCTVSCSLCGSERHHAAVWLRDRDGVFVHESGHVHNRCDAMMADPRLPAPLPARCARSLAALGLRFLGPSADAEGAV